MPDMDKIKAAIAVLEHTFHTIGIKPPKVELLFEPSAFFDVIAITAPADAVMEADPTMRGSFKIDGVTFRRTDR